MRPLGAQSTFVSRDVVLSFSSPIRLPVFDHSTATPSSPTVSNGLCLVLQNTPPFAHPFVVAFSLFSIVP